MDKNAGAMGSPFGFEFNGKRLTILQILGVFYFLAREVGQALGGPAPN